MQNRSLLIGVGCLLLVLGCDQTRWNIFKNNEPPPPTKVPTAEQLVKYLNDNAGLVHTLHTDNLSLTCYQGIQSWGLTGKMVTEKPRNLRMVADVGGSRVVDMGSNAQEFWYWVSKADPPYQFFCSYEALRSGQVKHMPFPFQPEWILEAMGLGTYGPAQRYQVEPDDRTVKLIERTTSPQGKAVKKVIVFNRKRVNPPQAQMTSCLLIDEATGKEICSAQIMDTHLDPATQAILPRRLELRWPESKLKLAMTLNGLNVNQPPPADVFVRHPLNGVPSFDLATGRLNGQPIQRLQSSQ